MKAGMVILVLLLILALVFGGAYVGRRNQMAIKREAVNAAWAQVDVVLQRRVRLDSQSGGDREGLCDAGTESVWRHRRGARGVGRSKNPG